MSTQKQLLEHKALEMLDLYNGSNNYILQLKLKKQNNKKFYPTRSQAEYILSYYDTVPKVARKWVDLDTYFSEKFTKERYLLETPKKLYIEKLLVEKEKSYHIWGKFFENEKLSEFWIPKSSIIKHHTTKKVEIDYSKYDHRPPLQHQKEAIEKLVGSKRFILADSMGVGKGLVKSTIVYTPCGRKKIGDLCVGDSIIGSDGLTYQITGVYPQPKQEIYEITFNDGVKIKTDSSHLWSVSSASTGKNSNSSHRKKSLVLSTKQMFDGGKIKIKGVGYNKEKVYEVETYYKCPNGNNKWQIPVVEPIRFERNDILPIDPYLLGLGLGDGSFKNKTIRFSVHKDDYDEMFGLFPLNEFKTRINQRGGSINVGTSLYDLGVERTRSHTKFIPDIYKYSSIENRLAIIQGLMDTDGHCMKSKKGVFGGTEYSTVSEKLADDVTEIIHSLGGIVRRGTKIGKYKKEDGTVVECRRVYRLNIKLPNEFNPFRLKRKANEYNPPKKYKIGRYIKNIEPCGQSETICISVDSPDKLYVTEHCIVTHNTTSTIIASLETGAKKVLVICPASLKINWQREIALYSDRPVFIAEGKNFSTEHDFVIVNYDILKNFYDLKDKENSPLIKANFDLVILDEAHLISNPQAARTKIINAFVKNIKQVWLLTGTPMTNRPMNYFNLLNIIENPVAQNWMAYAIRYCQGYQFRAGKRKVWNVSGASNLDELRERTSGQILRRLKEDVLDLPEKIITPIYLKLNSKEYTDLSGEYYDWLNGGEGSSTLSVQFTKLMKLRKLIADEKVKHTIDFVEHLLDQDKKVIIFTNFTETLHRIYEHFGQKAVYLDGSCNKVQRQYAVDQFQQNDKVRVFVGNLKAAGVGLTLTAAEIVVMNDLSFVPAEHAQAEDRAYRYGQRNNVLVYYPLFENTLEMIVYNILNNKKKIINTVMGDNLDESGGDTVEQILNSIKNQYIY